MREHKKTPIDNWTETTPTISYASIQKQIEESKKSSQAQNYIAGLCVLEIFSLEGIYVSEFKKSELEKEATKIIKDKLKDLIEDYTRHLNKEILNLNTKILQLEDDRKYSIKRINELKKAGFDFLREEDTEAFKNKLYGIKEKK